MRLILALFIGLFACNQPEPAEKAEAKDSATVQSTNAETSSNNTPYAQYIPQHVFDLLKHKLPDWNIPGPDNWEEVWFRQYRKDSSLVNYLPSDFNCDGNKDFALLLSDSKGEMAVWVLQSDARGYEAIKLRDLGKLRKPVGVGIELIPKGKLNHIGSDGESARSVELNCPAIQVLFFEMSAVTYYWNKGRYEMVQTGD